MKSETLHRGHCYNKAVYLMDAGCSLVRQISKIVQCHHHHHTITITIVERLLLASFFVICSEKLVETRTHLRLISLLKSHRRLQKQIIAPHRIDHLARTEDLSSGRAASTSTMAVVSSWKSLTITPRCFGNIRFISNTCTLCLL